MNISVKRAADDFTRSADEMMRNSASADKSVMSAHRYSDEILEEEFVPMPTGYDMYRMLVEECGLE